MKKNPTKEVIIGLVATAVGGFLVKKAYQYFQDHPDQTLTDAKNSLLDKARHQVDKVIKRDDNAVTEEVDMKDTLMSTLAYTLTVFGLTKFLRRVW